MRGRTLGGRSDLTLLNSEILIISFVVWMKVGWDAALLTAVGLICVFILLAQLSEQYTNIIAGAIGCVWAVGMAYILIVAKASVITWLVFVPAVAVIGFAVHFVALERLRTE
jgi:hypothetical protein